MSHALEIWMLLKLMATVFVLPFHSLSALEILAFSYKDYVEQFLFLVVLIIMALDSIFDIFLMVASYKKSISMFKVYYLFVMIYTILVPIFFVSWFLYATFVLDMDLFTPEVNQNVTDTLVLIVGVLIAHFFAVILIKVEIINLKTGCEFTKETSAATLYCLRRTRSLRKN